ncbi:MAG: hypothetical protein J6D47_20055 [Peptostreptococcaceae bacterium]|nr:hypothetical protein [Peptostreptococcaceae bacterium]
MQEERLIGYRPNLEYQDEYTSDATDYFDKQQQGEEDSQEQQDNIIGDLIDQMEIIDSLVDKLPGDASDIVGEITDQIIEFIDEELKDKEYQKVPEKEYWYYEEDFPPPGPVPEWTEPEPEPEEDPEIIEDPFAPIDPFPFIKETHPEHEIIEKEYIKNLVDLFNDYAVNMHTALSNFWTNLVSAVLNKQSTEIDLLVDNILLNSSDIQPQSLHLLDSAIRNQIIRTSKLDFYSNIFNAEETIAHLKQFKAMYELRLRYAKIEKVDGSTKEGQMNNNILEGMRITYDKKYDIAYENLLRYLKSSTDVLDDTLKTWLVEIKSKQTLIERNGIK